MPGEISSNFVENKTHSLLHLNEAELLEVSVSLYFDPYSPTFITRSVSAPPTQISSDELSPRTKEIARRHLGYQPRSAGRSPPAPSPQSHYSPIYSRDSSESKSPLPFSEASEIAIARDIFIRSDLNLLASFSPHKVEQFLKIAETLKRELSFVLVSAFKTDLRSVIRSCETMSLITSSEFNPAESAEEESLCKSEIDPGKLTESLERFLRDRGWPDNYLFDLAQNKESQFLLTLAVQAMDLKDFAVLKGIPKETSAQIHNEVERRLEIYRRVEHLFENESGSDTDSNSG